MSPQRIQRKRVRGWRMPEGAVYVGRPTKWGNPYRVGDEINDQAMAGVRVDGVPIVRAGVVADAEHAVELYQVHVRMHVPFTEEDVFRDLAGFDYLACWCPSDRPCHADVLLHLLAVAECQPRPSPETGV